MNAKERALREAKQEHGIPGQLSRIVLDKESEITGYGKHNRLLVFLCGNGQVMVREDHIGLCRSTEADRQKVLNSPRRQHPRKTHCVFVVAKTTLTNTYWYYNVVK